MTVGCWIPTAIFIHDFLRRLHYQSVSAVPHLSPLSPHLSPPGHGKKLNDFSDVTAVTAVTACFWRDGKKARSGEPNHTKMTFLWKGLCT